MEIDFELIHGAMPGDPQDALPPAAAPGNGGVVDGGACQATIPTSQPPPTTAPCTSIRPPFRDVVLCNAVVRAPRGGLTEVPGRATGPSGLRPQDVLDCLNLADSAAKAGLLEALTTLVTPTSTGRLQPRAAPYLCEARLIPVRKKDGEVRPIAVGDTLRRLVEKWLLASAHGRIAAAYLAPLHTAFAKVSPCEVVATGQMLLQAELQNAFNSIVRQAVLEALERQCPSLLPWVRQAFQPAPLLVGRIVIWSTRGVQQCDPLGPFMFASFFQAALDALLPRGTMHML